MTGGDEYSTDAARAAAARDELGDWVADFLRSPGSDNPFLVEILNETPRWWSEKGESVALPPAYVDAARRARAALTGD